MAFIQYVQCSVCKKTERAEHQPQIPMGWHTIDGSHVCSGKCLLDEANRNMRWDERRAAMEDAEAKQSLSSVP